MTSSANLQRPFAPAVFDYLYFPPEGPHFQISTTPLTNRSLDPVWERAEEESVQVLPDASEVVVVGSTPSGDSLEMVRTDPKLNFRVLLSEHRLVLVTRPQERVKGLGGLFLRATGGDRNAKEDWVFGGHFPLRGVQVVLYNESKGNVLVRVGWLTNVSAGGSGSDVFTTYAIWLDDVQAVAEKIVEAVVAERVARLGSAGFDPMKWESVDGAKFTLETGGHEPADWKARRNLDDEPVQA